MATKKKHVSASKRPAPESKGSAPATKKPAPASRKPASVQASANRNRWIALGVAVAIIGIAVALASGGTKNAGATPEEAKYLNRFLPANYQEPRIAGITTYSSAVAMTKLTATQDKTGVSIPAADVVKDKIVYFEYKTAGAKPLPMLAYVKPSGKLFVGVSYCPPCQGQLQRIESDVTLTCESCGTKRNLETGVGISGACKLYPLDELPSTVVGEKIVVEEGTIAGWSAQPLDRKVGQ